MIQFLAELAQLKPFVDLEIAVVGGLPPLSGKLMNQFTSNVVHTLIVWFFRNYSILGCIDPISTPWLKKWKLMYMFVIPGALWGKSNNKI